MPGYFPNGYFQSAYWYDSYWPDYGDALIAFPICTFSQAIRTFIYTKETCI